MPDTFDPLEPWIISEQEWVYIALEPVETDEPEEEAESGGEGP